MDTTQAAKRLRCTGTTQDMQSLSDVSRPKTDEGCVGTIDDRERCRLRPSSDHMVRIVIGLRHICCLVKGNDYVRSQLAHGEDFLYVFVNQADMLSDVSFLLKEISENLRARHQIHVCSVPDLTLRHYGQEPIEFDYSLDDVWPALCHSKIPDTTSCSSTSPDSLPCRRGGSGRRGRPNAWPRKNLAFGPSCEARPACHCLIDVCPHPWAREIPFKGFLKLALRFGWYAPHNIVIDFTTSSWGQVKKVCCPMLYVSWASAVLQLLSETYGVQSLGGIWLLKSLAIILEETWEVCSNSKEFLLQYPLYMLRLRTLGLYALFFWTNSLHELCFFSQAAFKAGFQWIFLISAAKLLS